MDGVRRKLNLIYSARHGLQATWVDEGDDRDTRIELQSAIRSHIIRSLEDCPNGVSSALCPGDAEALGAYHKLDLPLTPCGDVNLVPGKV